MQTLKKVIWNLPFLLLESFEKKYDRKNTTSYKRSIDNIIFLVTNLCNANCKHCFLYKVINKNLANLLTIDEIERFFNSLGKVRNIVLGGGEPFLRDDIDIICERLIKTSQPDLITIATNGLMPEIIFKKVKYILENTFCFIKISLSLDGPAHIHDGIRNVKGAFYKVSETYEKLLFLYYLFYPRLQLQINSTLFSENYPYFMTFYSLIKENFPEAIFTFEIARGNYDTSMIKPITQQQYEEIINFFETIEDIQLKDHIKLHKIALQIIKNRRQIIPCNAGSNFIVLDFYGNIYPCEMLSSVLNIRDINYDFNNILKFSEWKSVVEKINKKQCYCTHMCFLSASLVDNKDKITHKNTG